MIDSKKFVTLSKMMKQKLHAPDPTSTAQAVYSNNFNTNKYSSNNKGDSYNNDTPNRGSNKSSH